jgi:hypothetical protein
LKKRTKKLLQIQAEPLRKGRSQFGKSFLLLFCKKAGLPAAGLNCGRLPGQLRKRSKKLLRIGPSVSGLADAKKSKVQIPVVRGRVHTCHPVGEQGAE